MSKFIKSLFKKSSSSSKQKASKSDLTVDQDVSTSSAYDIGNHSLVVNVSDFG